MSTEQVTPVEAVAESVFTQLLPRGSAESAYLYNVLATVTGEPADSPVLVLATVLGLAAGQLSRDGGNPGSKSPGGSAVSRIVHSTSSLAIQIDDFLKAEAEDDEDEHRIGEGQILASFRDRAQPRVFALGHSRSGSDRIPFELELVDSASEHPAKTVGRVLSEYPTSKLVQAAFAVVSGEGQGGDGDVINPISTFALLFLIIWNSSEGSECGLEDRLAENVRVVYAHLDQLSLDAGGDDGEVEVDGLDFSLDQLLCLFRSRPVRDAFTALPAFLVGLVRQAASLQTKSATVLSPTLQLVCRASWNRWVEDLKAMKVE